MHERNHADLPTWTLLLASSLTIIASFATLAGCAAPPASEHVETASAVPLVSTNWRLTLLGDRVIDNADGPSAVGLQLQPENMRLTGFAGCNRMFGGYLLNADQLKFDQVGATKMACLDESRMKLEQEYFTMLSAVARWKITDRTLELADSTGTPLATFAAAPPRQQ
jgi:heat shock protein HslJ